MQRRNRSLTYYPDLAQQFGLTIEQFFVVESIRYLSTSDPDYTWCIQSKDEIAEYCGISERTVYRTIKYGISLDKPIIKVSEQGVRTTKLWNSLISDLKDEKTDTKSVLTQSQEKTDTKSKNPDTVSAYNSNKRINKRNVDKHIQFNFETSEWIGITEQDMAKWKNAYPDVDITQKLKRFALWLSANPHKAKQDYNRFIIIHLGRDWNDHKQTKQTTPIANSDEVENRYKGLEKVYGKK